MFVACSVVSFPSASSPDEPPPRPTSYDPPVNKAERDRIEGEVRRLADGSPLELYDLRIGQDRSVHALVDRRDGTRLSVDDAARFNHLLRRELALVGVDVDAWSIEVESPGVTRPLKVPRHYERSLGQRVRIVRRDPMADPRVVIGILREAGAVGCRVEAEGGGAIVEIAYSDVSDARLDPKLPF
jgi:ribosome maturation factor RimP